jgi:DNA-directed RNA polymerase subunit alpha
MIELESPQIEPVEEAGTYAKYEAGPLQAGYGVTLGNALRRVLLSSLEGAAVTSIQIRDIYQEFSTIPGVKEDVTQIVLNVKKLRLKSYAGHPVQLRLIKSGAGAVTAADIERAVRALGADPGRVAAMASAAANVTDGHGTERVVTEIEAMLATKVEAR